MFFGKKKNTNPLRNRGLGEITSQIENVKDFNRFGIIFIN
jgi:hypothetical protein